MSFGGKAFNIALILHVLFFLALIVGVLWEYLFKDDPPDHVFVMVSPQQAAAESIKRAQQRKPVARVVRQPLAQPPAQKRIQKPPPVRKAVSKPKPPPKKAPPALKRVSYDSSRYAQKTPKTTPKKTVQQKPQKKVVYREPVKIAPVKMNTSSMRNSLLTAQVDSSDPKELQSEISAYGQKLRALIEAEWVSVKRQLSAEVKILVSPDGRLTATIMRSSGDYAFDQSILDAVYVVRVGPPPGGKLRTYFLTLSAREG